MRDSQGLTCRPVGATACGLVALLVAQAASLFAATYCVDQRAENAADTNAGTEEAPWKTVARAGSGGQR